MWMKGRVFALVAACGLMSVAAVPILGVGKKKEKKEKKECECSIPLNRVTHFEIHAEDPEATAEFYHTVFGWEITKWENSDFDYWMVMTGPYEQAGGINGGIMRRMGPKAEGMVPVSSFVCSLSVASVEESMAKVEQAGGSVVVPMRAVPQVGWLCYCQDLDGNIFGMMQSDPNAA